MKTDRVKVRPLAPAEAKAMELARNAIKPMCDLFRMVPQEDWSPATLGADGEMRRRFFEAEEALKRLEATLPKTLVHKPGCPEIFAQYGDKDCHCKAKTRAAGEPIGRDPDPPRKSLFAENERMHLGSRGYSESDIRQIRSIAARLVEGRVLKGEVDPEKDDELKAAVKQAGRDALQAFNAAVEYVSG